MMPFYECIPGVQVLLTMLISNPISALDLSYYTLPTSHYEERVANDIVCRKSHLQVLIRI